MTGSVTDFSDLAPEPTDWAGDWPMPGPLSPITSEPPEAGDEEICDVAVRAVADTFDMDPDEARKRLTFLFSIQDLMEMAREYECRD